MLRVLLVDDEEPLLDELEYLLNKYENVEISAKYTNPLEALKDIDIVESDAVFLDIDMPILNGLNLAREIMNINKNILRIIIRGIQIIFLSNTMFRDSNVNIPC